MNKSERDKKLDELKDKFKAYVQKKRDALELERKFLELVLEKQGFTAAGRSSANLDKLKSIATVKQLLPTINF